MEPAVTEGMTLVTNDAISQEASTLGMPHSLGMVTAMTKDASDGIMDGKMGGTFISMNGMGGGGMMMSNMQCTAGTSGLATAMTAFIVSAQNKAGPTAANTTTS